MGRVYKGTKPSKERQARYHLLFEEAWSAALDRGAVRCTLLIAGAHYPGVRAEDGQPEVDRFEATKLREAQVHARVYAHYDPNWCLDPAKLSAIPPGLKGLARQSAQGRAAEDARADWCAAFYPSRFIDTRLVCAALDAHAQGAPLVLPTPTFVPVAWERKETPMKSSTLKAAVKKAAAPRAKKAPVPVAPPVAPAPSPAPQPVPAGPARGYTQLGLADWARLAA